MHWSYIFLPGILTIGGTLIIILTMLLEDLAGGYVLIGLGMIVLGVISYWLSDITNEKSDK